MTRTTKSTRPANLAQFATLSAKTAPKIAPKKLAASSSTTKTKRLKPMKRTPLATAVTTSIEAVRFGSVSENAMLYLKEGTENLINELQVAIAAKEMLKKNALKTLQTFQELPVNSTMSEIRERLNVVVVALQNVFEVL